MRASFIPRLNSLPANVSIDGAVRIELTEGIPILRTSSSVQDRIENLLIKQKESNLDSAEEQELDRYGEIDDYFSFVNHTIITNILSQLKHTYSLGIDDHIFDYLERHLPLIAILFELLPIVIDQFKNDQLHLTIIKDPEHHTLDKFAIIVTTHLNAATAFEKLQELDNLCFQASIPNDILVHVEF